MTNFCFEIPIPHLEEFHRYQDYGFALSYLFKDKDYCNYIESFKREGKVLVIDNSFNELDIPDSVDTLAALYRQYKPNFVVSPDADQWDENTLFDTYEELCIQVPERDVILVVRTPSEYERAVNSAVYNLAIPYEFRPYMPDKILGHQRIHFLGYLNPKEIETYRPYTCDTSMAIKLAWKGLSARQWMEEGFIHMASTDFPEGLLTKVLFKQQLESMHNTIKEIKRGFGLYKV